MTIDLQTLKDTCTYWADRIRPADWPREVTVKRLPRPSYEGDNPYNGFTGTERRRGMQVLQVLIKQGVIQRPKACDICGKTERVGYHGEDYFDPFSMAQLCFPCHMALHRRFKSPDKWHALLDRNSASPHIAAYHTLPMVEPDFASWLRENTSGPFDPVEWIWPDREVPDYQPRRKNTPDIAKAIQNAAPTEAETACLEALHRMPGATSSALTEALGWSGNSAWHLVFGKFCKRLEPGLGPAPTTNARKDAAGKPAKFYIGLLADYDATTKGFTLKPEVAHACFPKNTPKS